MKMKKVFKILSAAVLFAASLVLGSCSEDDEIVQVLQGPANVWCRMPVDYTSDSDSSSTANLYAYFYYTENDTTVSGKTLPAGLSVVVTARGDTDSIISELKNNTYLIKSFPKDETTTVGDSEDDAASINVNGSRAKWTAIYWAKDPLREAANKSTTPPSQLSGTELSTDDIKNVFSWKKLLANYLLSILEE